MVVKYRVLGNWPFRDDEWEEANFVAEDARDDVTENAESMERAVSDVVSEKAAADVSEVADFIVWDVPGPSTPGASRVTNPENGEGEPDREYMTGFAVRY